MRSALVSASLWALLQQSACVSVVPSFQPRACQQLEQLYANQTLLSGQTGFVEAYEEIWSETCIQKPFCVFEPTTATQVAAAVRILVQSNTSFAIRSGGHMQVPGASAITNGVLISTQYLNEKQFLNAEHSLASIGPGNRWIDVYNWLAPYKVAAIGGRYQPVGVGGLQLGGGISYFGSQHGWAVNSVVNFQVVLANASIVDANATHNADLWWALKGGSSNFGIVTRYDMRLYPIPGGVFGGTTIYQPQYLDQFLEAVAGYAALEGGSSDVLTSVNPTLYWNFTTGGYGLETITTRNSSDTNSSSIAAFANFTAIPQVSSDAKLHSNLVGLTADTAATGIRTQRDLFFSVGLQATPEAIYLANQTYFETIAAWPAVRAAKGMQVAATWQTITQAWLNEAVALGGDAIALDPANGTFIAFLGAMNWDDAADDDAAYAFAYNFTRVLTKRARDMGVGYPFVYLNDAEAHQDVYSFYGGGKSLPRLIEVAKAYDPHGVFQRLVPGGFKLNGVQ